MGEEKMLARKTNCSGSPPPHALGRKLSVALHALLAAAALGMFAFLRGQDAPSARQENSTRPDAGVLKPVPNFEVTAKEDFISPDDLLEVYVVDVAEISREYRVSPGGSITVPLLNDPIPATGLVPAQLAQAIGERLRAAGMVTNPQVTVAIKESRLRCVAVTGAVSRPQLYPFSGRTTLLDVISQAGGLAEEAGTTAVITRGDLAMRVLSRGRRDGTDLPRVVTADLKRLLETGDSELNLDLYPGDRVTVQRAGVFYVVGAVNRPGGFTLKNYREEMTVLKALALAEDLKPTAIRNKAMILRKNTRMPEGREEIALNLQKILAGRAPDQPVKADDILFVPDSSSKRAMRRGAEAAIQIATGVIIWRR
jgi:polysaccharide export outer membrane protein